MTFDYLTIQERIPRIEDEDPEGDLSVKTQAKRLACAEGTIRRAIQEDLNPYQADRLCVKGLGLHPAGIFGFDAWVYADDVVLDESGEPAADVDAVKIGRKQRMIA